MNEVKIQDDKIKVEAFKFEDVPRAQKANPTHFSITIDKTQYVLSTDCFDSFPSLEKFQEALTPPELSFIQNQNLFIFAKSFTLIFSDLYECEQNPEFDDFVKNIADVSDGNFKIATAFWDDSMQTVYYIMKKNASLNITCLDRDDWEEHIYFKELAKDNGYDPDSDEFYEEDDDTSESPASEIADLVYEELCSDPTILAPDLFLKE